MSLRHPSVLLVPALVLTALACGGSVGDAIEQKATEEAISAGTGGQVDVSSGSLTVKGDNGTGSMTIGSAATLPDGFPSDVPMYPGSTITMSLNAPDGNGKPGFMVTADTADAPTAIADFYKGKLDGPYSKTADMNMDGSVMQVWTSKDGKSTVTLNAAQGGGSDGKNSISIVIGSN